MYPACKKFGVAGIPWSPVAMGMLTRPIDQFNATTRGEGMGKGMMVSNFSRPAAEGSRFHTYWAKFTN